MTKTQRELMASGEWYSCIDDELEELRMIARQAVHEHNTLEPQRRGNLSPKLTALLHSVGPGSYLEAPFHCAYGFNISIGENVYLNAGCVILDTANVTIGDETLIGPGVHIYCAQHATEADQRRAGMEIAHPVSIGRNAWIGGGAIVMPDISIGDDAIVGAGCVVTKDVEAGQTVVGNPARPV
ncbi:sugar O-acetyltransferase [bacterium]|nr:sugar O-acetyltransferase [bacterium]